jgi:acetyl-CoA carboxylase biotin carboxyl carrier protein
MWSSVQKILKLEVLSMNIENIKALAEVVKTFGLSSLEVEDGETRIKIDCSANVSAPIQNVSHPSATHESLELSSTYSSVSHTIRSPLIGVCYTADSPDAKPFVRVGSKVKRGDVLCIIETMKLMNEVTAEQDCEIVEINIVNGEIVEFGQVLFRWK